MNNLPISLKNAFSQKSLIPIVGAGVSMAVKRKDGTSLFPSWRQLLELGAEKLRLENKLDLATATSAMLRVGKYTAAAQLIREGLTGSLWRDFFREVFELEMEAVSTESLEIIRAIWRTSPRIVTLNYDKLIRLGSPSANLLEIDNSAKAELAEFERRSGKTNMIWHLHGRLDNINKMILTAESYDRLYVESNPEYQAALEILCALIRNSNLLFVGCSLDDAELLQKFSEQHKIFDGATGPHYALVHSNEVQSATAKLRNLPIDVIPFDDFGQPLIDTLDRISGHPVSSGVVLAQITRPPVSSSTSERSRVAILTAEPINRSYEHDDFLREIKKLKCEVVHFPLSLESLNNLENFNYIFIASSAVKGRVIAEDEALSSVSLSFKDIEDNIDTSEIDGIFILLDHNDVNNLNATDLEKLQAPTIIFPRLSKEQLFSLTFKLFKKHEPGLICECIVLNESRLRLKEIKGEHSLKRYKTALPPNIDRHSAKSYVGRATDLENICRKITRARDRNELVTIKGSGGIGKTSTVKKIAIELANRNLFKAGIVFVDCEAIPSYEVFEYNVAQIFNLEDASDVRKQLTENFSKTDSLLILDNIESLLYLSDKVLILSFITFVCDYSTVVVTSRELLGIPCEDPYELRPFTTDEAFSLFENEIAAQIPTGEDTRFVRHEILEALLDNNPLAIKLISNNMPRNKSFRALKAELEENFFQKVSNAELNAFNDFGDTNIEKKKSLYASINYSYRYLRADEKTAFELLSLFPDGINIESFKQVSAASADTRKRWQLARNSKSNFVITDSIIKSLESKSLIQVDNHMIKLQSIVRKFSEHQLSERGKEEWDAYRHRAFQYNYEFANALLDLKDNDQYRAIRIFNNHQNNFLKCLSIIEPEDTPVNSFNRFVATLSYLFSSVSACRTFGEALESKGNLFPDDDLSRRCFELAKIGNEYYDGQFESAYEKLRALMPLDEISDFAYHSEIERLILNHSTGIYCMEGAALKMAEIDVKTQYTSTRYPYSLFSIGVVDKTLMECSSPNFFTLELRAILGTLTLEQIDQYISSIYEKDHLELMQSYYAKVKFVGVDDSIVSKLVVVNPFTAGLKDLMLAFSETKHNSKKRLFESALSRLEHIKYYYVEALFYYSSYLHAQGDVDFESYFGRGLELSRHHHYRFLEHQFNMLHSPTPVPYDPEQYPLPTQTDFSQYVQYLIAYARSSHKRRTKTQ